MTGIGRVGCMFVGDSLDSMCFVEPKLPGCDEMQICEIGYF